MGDFEGAEKPSVTEIDQNPVVRGKKWYCQKRIAKHGTVCKRKHTV